MKDSGSFQVTASELTQAAGEIDDAAQTDLQAEQQVRSVLAESNQAFFGISGQAQAAARNWALSLEARADDARALHDETHQLAEELRAAAQQYQQGEQQNEGTIGASGRGLHHPHVPHVPHLPHL